MLRSQSRIDALRRFRDECHTVVAAVACRCVGFACRRSLVAPPACASHRWWRVVVRLRTDIADFVDVQIGRQRDVTMLAEVAGKQVASVRTVTEGVRHGD
jgi:hypothetical protein